jgi:hypothetical protein
LPYGDVWISNAVAETFGLISFSDQLPDLAWVEDLVGAQPAIGEEFDVE